MSVHLYFYDDRFQGYLVRQEVQNLGSKVRETLEMWAVPQATLVLEKNLKELERLKNLEVGPLRVISYLRRSRRAVSSKAGCVVSVEHSILQSQLHFEDDGILRKLPRQTF